MILVEWNCVAKVLGGHLAQEVCFQAELGHVNIFYSDQIIRSFQPAVQLLIVIICSFQPAVQL